jgi:NADH-quinone oxidoreductase subunit G
VTAKKDEYAEVHDYICNECRFEHYSAADWVVEGPRQIEDTSVINQNKYDAQTKPLGKITQLLDNDKWENQ